MLGEVPGAVSRNHISEAVVAELKGSVKQFITEILAVFFRCRMVFEYHTCGRSAGVVIMQNSSLTIGRKSLRSIFFKPITTAFVVQS